MGKAQGSWTAGKKNTTQKPYDGGVARMSAMAAREGYKPPQNPAYNIFRKAKQNQSSTTTTTQSPISIDELGVYPAYLDYFQALSPSAQANVYMDAYETGHGSYMFDILKGHTPEGNKNQINKINTHFFLFR